MLVKSFSDAPLLCGGRFDENIKLGPRLIRRGDQEHGIEK
jgi:hypothetical protein